MQRKWQTLLCVIYMLKLLLTVSILYNVLRIYVSVLMEKPRCNTEGRVRYRRGYDCETYVNVEEMERRYWVVLLLPSLTLVALFLSSRFMQHWRWHPLQPRFNNEDQKLTAWHATQKALALLEHQEADLLDKLNLTSEQSHKEFVANVLKLNQQLQHILELHYEKAKEVNYPACQKASREQMTGSEGIPWRPNVGRYMVMLCDSGQLTNHLICFQKYMYMAALLNRTLVLPHETLDYKYEQLLDIAHLKKCLGNTSIIGFEDFRKRMKGDLHINELICYMHDCYFDKDHRTKWEELGFTFGKRQDAWPTSFQASHISTKEVLSKFVCGEEVIAVGDLFYAEIVDSQSFAVAHACRNLVQPHRNIVVTAQRFVQTYLGSNFLSLHFRRHGFLVFCNKQPPSCFYPIPQAAKCIQKKFNESGAAVIYLSTDAPPSEIALLKELVRVPVVTRTEVHEAAAKWDSLLWRKGLESDPAVMTMVDKTICALAVAFIGTQGSTFSDDIQRMRNDWGTAASCDGQLCKEEVPSFLAEFP